MNETADRTAPFGLIAVILGFIAFAGVVGHFFGGPIDPPPPVELSIAEKAVDIRDATIAALRGEKYEAEPVPVQRRLDDYLTYALIVSALLAILMALIGLLRRESLRTNLAGAALGGLAITFQYVTVMFFALLFALLLAAVIDKLDFSVFD